MSKSPSHLDDKIIELIEDRNGCTGCTPLYHIHCEQTPQWTCLSCAAISLNNKECLKWDLDDILSELGLGMYQVVNFMLIGLMLMFSNISPLSFTLTASDLDYRCYVAECDKMDAPVYDASWVRDVIPLGDDGHLDKCARYPSVPVTNSNGSCNAFDTTRSVKCPDDKYVVATTEVTLVNEFNIYCDKFKLTSVGSINNIGQVFGISLFGIISDRYGRKLVAVVCTVISSIFGLLRAISNNYFTFVAFEFLDSFFSSGIYGAAFVLGLELVTPRMRPIAGTLMGAFYPLGAVYMGFLGWYFWDWRKMLLASYMPGLLFLIYYWFVPESIRWLQTNNRHDEAIQIIKNIAKKNKKSIRDSVIDTVIRQHDFHLEENDNEGVCHFWTPIKTAMKSKYILIRVMICSFCWFANTLVYYGLSLNSVSLAGNKYVNFILSNLVEVPAFFVSGMIMEKCRRRPSQASAFILSGIGCILCEFIPPHILWLKLTLYMTSKFMITMSFNILYIFSVEMFPTALRLSLFGISSMIGRTGSILAPQTPLLAEHLGRHVPIVLFGVITLTAGFMSTFFPETYNQKLPDTIDEVKSKKNERE